MRAQATITWGGTLGGPLAWAVSIAGSCVPGFFFVSVPLLRFLSFSVSGGVHGVLRLVPLAMDIDSGYGLCLILHRLGDLAACPL